LAEGQPAHVAYRRPPGRGRPDTHLTVSMVDVAPSGQPRQPPNIPASRRDTMFCGNQLASTVRG